MAVNKQERILNFAREARSYAFEYATRKSPGEATRRLSGRFGHAIGLFDAMRQRQLRVQAIQTTAVGLTPNEIVAGRDLAAEQFKYTKRFERVVGNSKPGEELVTECEVIEDYFDRVEVGSLLDEVVAIGLGDFSQVKSVGTCFGVPMRPAPQPAFGGRVARYKAWLRS